MYCQTFRCLCLFGVYFNVAVVQKGYFWAHVCSYFTSRKNKSHHSNRRLGDKGSKSMADIRLVNIGPGMFTFTWGKTVLRKSTKSAKRSKLQSVTSTTGIKKKGSWHGKHTSFVMPALWMTEREVNLSRRRQAIDWQERGQYSPE